MLQKRIQVDLMISVSPSRGPCPGMGRMNFIGIATEVVLTLWKHIGTIQLVRLGPLAQLVEQRPFKAWVTGSNPVWLIGIYTGANTI